MTRPARTRWLVPLTLLVLLVGSGQVGSAAAAPEGPGPTPVQTPPPASGADTVGQLVVKVAPGVGIDVLNRRLGSTTLSTLLASRNIYLLEVPLTQPADKDHDEKDHDEKDEDEKDEDEKDDDEKQAKAAEEEWSRQVKRLLDSLAHDPAVVYAEANEKTGIAEGSRFHHWPSGGPVCTGSDASGYRSQPAVTRLELDRVHRRARGAGRVIAVLDTGIDASHPALSGRIVRGGYDYVDDDGSPSEVPMGLDEDGDGLVDEGFGHGTFVAGLAALAAPAAQIMPLRVLDAEGRGNTFAVAEAIYDAAAAGADVINLSFGTASTMRSKVLDDAMKAAEHSGAVIVAAAGNDGSTVASYPASMSGVVSVAAQADRSSALATFSSRGNWVDLAAPGDHVVSTLPCGYGSWSGTSMAAPFVSGAAALLGGREPRAKPKDIRTALTEGSDKVRGLQVHSGALNLTRSLDKID